MNKYNKTVKMKKRRVKIEMSTELDALLNGNEDEQTQLDNIAKIYCSCFSDKDVKINSVRFIDQEVSK